MATCAKLPDRGLRERRRDGDRVEVRRQVAGRHGKAVTTVSGVPVDDAGLKELATKLKKRCGVGGSVKHGVIEIQGDHREVVMQIAEGRGLRPRPRRRMMRVDKWLWTARLLKTRALAAEAVRAGHVHVNGVAVKPSREVSAGDELELTLGPVQRTLIVRDAAERRVSAAEAAKLYSETEQSIAERERQAELRRLGGPVDLGGRPTKRDRRRFDAGRARSSATAGRAAGPGRRAEAAQTD